MSDQQQFVIDLGTDGRAIVDTDDRAWLDERLRREQGPARMRVRLDDSDTEGHAMSASEVRVLVGDEDDTEGHALSIHFPTPTDADAFRKRLMVAGALAGTVALGGIGLANLPSDGGSTGASGTTVTTQAGMDWTQAERQATIGAAQTGPMDAHEAPAFQGLSAADQAYADRLTGQAEAAQTGPMDAHEAPAFEGLSAADQAYADRLTGQAEAAQTGPMDAHEAPAFQGASSDTDEGEAPPQQGGPIPR